MLAVPALCFAGIPDVACDVVLKNIDCDDEAETISFDLTWSSDGLPFITDGRSRAPITTRQPQTIVIGTNSDVVYDDNTSINLDDALATKVYGAQTTFDDLRVTANFNNNVSCANFEAFPLYFYVRDVLVSEVPRPTEPGNWDTYKCTPYPIRIQADPFMSTSQDLPTFGQWSLILFGLGILSLAIVVLVRRGKEITI